jgi:hypothetical protein
MRAIALRAVAACSGLLAGLMLVKFALSGAPESSTAPTSAFAANAAKLDGLATPSAPEKPQTARVATAVIAPPAETGEVLQADTPEGAGGDGAMYVAVIATVGAPPAAKQVLNDVLASYAGVVGPATQAAVEPVKAPDGATWYRTYLLPALPRAQAKDLCRRLREAGHSACWVKLYKS